ncbi:MAG: purine-nucleoside/S-methyl-5-thioadenosine phosphorylase / adenosine deaminase [Solirubrobacteraceae bacterium]|jgi:YfiH family protein|nr:purine-nucleoside/S-methyl-5-thioadenosine phosphorylase / adenosine deaminase [Solirubrobacteraceae bacterium]
MSGAMSTPPLPGPFFSFHGHFAVDLSGAWAVFTTRRGGASSGPYASLNLGLLTDDAPSAVRHNRRTLEVQVGSPVSFVRQVHGTGLLHTTAADAERRRTAGPGELPEGDGQFTTERGCAVAVLTADCLPVAVAGGGAVAMLHAGWRGLAGGILERGAAALRALGAAGPLSAAIGPGAGPCCYEVGDEVHAVFRAEPGHVHRGRHLDLPAIARERLARAGVAEVHDIGLCTICSDPELLFSHRRDHGVTGRQAGLAWLG